MEETLRRRITVTSSLNEISSVWWWGGALLHLLQPTAEAKSEVPDWDKVDSGTGLSTANVLESTLEWT
jgi:hypothetical protein